MMKKEKRVYLTMLTNEKYIPGIKAVSLSLEKTGTTIPLVILVPQDKRLVLENKLSAEKILSDKCYVIDAPPITADMLSENDLSYITSSKEAYWLDSFFKLRVWSLIQYEKIVYIDADMLILKNIDDLFDKPSYSAAVSTKCVVPQYVKLNAGLMVIEPDIEFYKKLLTLVAPVIARKKAAGLPVGDQDVHQEAFPDWEEHPELCLPETDNAVWFCIEDLCRVYQISTDAIRVVHFTGAVKPFTRTKMENLRLLASYLRHGQFWRFKVYREYLRLSR